MVPISKFKSEISNPTYSVPYPSPNGLKLVVQETKANWKDNSYESNLLIYDTRINDFSQLTRSGKVTGFDWFSNVDMLVIQPDSDSKNQVWLYEKLMGDPIKLTNEPEGVQSVKSFGTGFVYLSDDPKKFKTKERGDHFGSFSHVEEEKPSSRLVYISVPMMKAHLELKKEMLEEDYKKEIFPMLDLTQQIQHPLKIYGYGVNLSSQRIFFTASEKEDLIFAQQLVNYIININPDLELAKYIEWKKKEDDNNIKNVENMEFNVGEIILVKIPMRASILDFSPDGQSLLLSYQERDDKYYTQRDLYTLDFSTIDRENEISEDHMYKITGSINKSIMGSKWTTKGIVVSYYNHTRGQLAIIKKNGFYEEIEIQGGWHSAQFATNLQGDIGAMVWHRDKEYNLIYLSNSQELLLPEVICKYPVDTISWISKDGTEIEGVIRKPQNFDPNKKYPLVLIVHGGPSWLSYESAKTIGDIRYYPSLEFAGEDIISVYPNYRGSIGRGQEFLELNVDNLGIGDLWDIESCVDHLVELGMVDHTRVGCMGWSQGGYISAFATTHSTKFAATSVGAGISDWYSYWATTDIRKFTHDYLSASPIKNREIYLNTAPMNAIQNAKTPTLIQIGENDRRVPLVNATELYRALIEKEVQTHLFVFSGMPHGINKPRENLAVVTQNYVWFMHYLKDTTLQLDLEFLIDNSSSD